MSEVLRQGIQVLKPESNELTISYESKTCTFLQYKEQTFHFAVNITGHAPMYFRVNHHKQNSLGGGGGGEREGRVSLSCYHKKLLTN